MIFMKTEKSLRRSIHQVTVFWFLLLTNAINLVDGLDGLASIYPDVCAGAVAPDEGIIIAN